MPQIKTSVKPVSSLATMFKKGLAGSVYPIGYETRFSKAKSKKEAYDMLIGLLKDFTVSATSDRTPIVERAENDLKTKMNPGKRQVKEKQFRGLKERTDLLRLGLGLGQKFNSFNKSSVSPTIGHINNGEQFIDFTDPETKDDLIANILVELESRRSAKKYGVQRGYSPYEDALGHFRISDDSLKNYVSYIDKWDFDNSIGKLMEIIGFYNPPSVYGRVPREKIDNYGN